MDVKKIKKWGMDKNRKKVPMTLHSRLELFKLKNPDLGDKLIAIKWLGNSGSHNSVLKASDVINGYALFEHVIREIFENHSEGLKKLTRRIIKKKGP
jgi:hypothetical protein